ncbi:MAG TPA: cytochrome c maturation protein CcmE [Ktedonobacteraceae bacterium]|nr:cytochrome c maturation protein CcmE [Ktedonobacteraceae bacterium]
MSQETSKPIEVNAKVTVVPRYRYIKFGSAIALIVLTLAYLAYLGAQESKSYYVTIKELHTMRDKQGDDVYKKKLRVAGNVEPGSIKMSGPHADFTLVENGETLHVIYKGSEPPPDTFKDNAQALAMGVYKRDGVFYANELQAKCASKYAPQQQPGAPAAQQPSKGY